MDMTASDEQYLGENPGEPEIVSDNTDKEPEKSNFMSESDILSNMANSQIQYRELELWIPIDEKELRLIENKILILEDSTFRELFGKRISYRNDCVITDEEEEILEKLNKRIYEYAVKYGPKVDLSDKMMLDPNPDYSNRIFYHWRFGETGFILRPGTPEDNGWIIDQELRVEISYTDTSDHQFFLH
jgi:hypothetical protein